MTEEATGITPARTRQVERAVGVGRKGGRSCVRAQGRDARRGAALAGLAGGLGGAPGGGGCTPQGTPGGTLQSHLGTVLPSHSIQQLSQHR